MSTDGHVLPLRAAVPLATALVVHRAESLGVRALVIKGISAEVHGLRQPRVSADVDVLVDPAGYDTLLDSLAQLGWRPRPMYSVSANLDPHSESLIHESWPCDIDLHRRFPGFLATPQTAFDALWDGRDFTGVAKVMVPIPGLAGALQVAALHSLRTVDGSVRMRTELEQVEQVITELTPAQQQELVDLSLATGAAGPLVDTFARGGIHVTVPDTPELRAWNARRLAGPVFAGNLVAGMRGRSMRARMQLLWLALWPTADELRAVNPALPDSTAALMGARLRRWGRGVMQLPQALAASRRSGQRENPEGDQ